MSGPNEGLSPVRLRRTKRLAALQTSKRRLEITFSILGVQKGASSTLYRMLTEHPDVVGGPEKEMRFFLEDNRDWKNPDYSEYVRPSGRRAKIAGDATPDYLFWPRALDRMAAYRPEMRVLAIFRDPIERAASQWSLQRSRNERFPDFPDTVDEYLWPELPTRRPAGMSHLDLMSRSLYLRGLYGQQVRNVLAHFPAEQWLPLEFKQVHSEHEAVLDRVTDFLELPRFVTHPKLRHTNQTPSTNVGAPLGVPHVQRLVDYFAPEITELVELTGLEVSHWPTARVIAGELDVVEFTDRINAKVGLG